MYKYYQAMQFATHGYCFQWDTASRQDCIQMLLDAARECHTGDNYTCFKKAVQAELIGKHSTPRYLPLSTRTSFIIFGNKGRLPATSPCT